MERARYEYHLLGDSVPVRVAFDQRGLKMGAEVPDAIQRRLVHANRYLSRLETSYEVEEIDEARFLALCEAIYERAGIERGERR